MDRGLYLIIHDVRSCHNVGSLLRTAEGLGVEKVYLTGYTPYPLAPNDTRLPHIAQKLHRQIHKTALATEDVVAWEHADDVFKLLANLRRAGVAILALEQGPGTRELPGFSAPDPVALLVGNEVEGVQPELLAVADTILEIPMLGKKESFNVVQAAAMALYQLRFG